MDVTYFGKFYKCIKEFEKKNLFWMPPHFIQILTVVEFTIFRLFNHMSMRNPSCSFSVKISKVVEV